MLFYLVDILESEQSNTRKEDDDDVFYSSQGKVKLYCYNFFFILYSVIFLYLTNFKIIKDFHTNLQN